tara:strand:+ start:164 stop:637 length:474 start_codon:yes stop_codon:yes gene_type:complete
MNIKNKFIVIFIFITLFTLAIVNVKNTEKTKFYLFTSKTEEISLGNLISLTFISGFTFSSLFNLISKNNLKDLSQDNSIDDDDDDDVVDNSNENNFYQELKSDRPPERDVRESQPTISVNYRFVDQDNDYFPSKNIKKNENKTYSEDNDWLNINDDW